VFKAMDTVCEASFVLNKGISGIINTLVIVDTRIFLQVDFKIICKGSLSCWILFG